MIHTFPHAELPLPSSLALNGERSWHWVELGLIVSHFLVRIELQTPEESVSRYIITTAFQFVLDNLNEDGVRVSAVYLLTMPDARNGAGPELHEIAQVWASNLDEGALIDLVFVLRSGVTMAGLRSSRSEVDPTTMRLVVDLESPLGVAKNSSSY